MRRRGEMTAFVGTFLVCMLLIESFGTVFKGQTKPSDFFLDQMFCVGSRKRLFLSWRDTLPRPSLRQTPSTNLQISEGGVPVQQG